MYPILLCALVAVAVVGERSFWWLRESSRRDPKKLEEILAALENGDVPPPNWPMVPSTRSST